MFLLIVWFFLLIVIDKFRHKGMDMGVPFQIPAEGVKCTNHPELIKIPVIAEQIGIVFGIS